MDSLLARVRRTFGSEQGESAPPGEGACATIGTAESTYARARTALETLSRDIVRLRSLLVDASATLASGEREKLLAQLDAALRDLGACEATLRALAYPQT
jgi:hypothetical protein